MVDKNVAAKPFAATQPFIPSDPMMKVMLRSLCRKANSAEGCVSRLYVK